VGSGTPPGGAIEATFWLHNVGVILLALAHTAGAPLPGPLGVAALAGAAFSYAIGMRGFIRVGRTSPRPEVGQQALRWYVQLVFFWLLAGFVLLLVEELYWGARGLIPPHAYLGAVRHALTVGFMTTLILGHPLLPWPRLVLPTFLLIAAGNLLRVLTELATPLSTAAYAIMPFSAVLELSALTANPQGRKPAGRGPATPVRNWLRGDERPGCAVQDHLVCHPGPVNVPSPGAPPRL
jgi:hypothetical protein